MRKKILEKRLARLQAKKKDLAARAQASQDVNEVRSLNDQINDVNAEIEETQEELNAINAQEEEERAAAAAASVTPPETREGIPANAQMVNGNAAAAASFQMGEANGQTRQNVDPTEAMEYRQAFMRYIQTGEPIPSNLLPQRAPGERRAGNAINTQDTGAAIPITVMRQVINTVQKRFGNLYSKVRKLNIPGGVEFPIGALQAKFKWLKEGTVSPRQKTEPLGRISFKYHEAEIRVAQTFLSNILTLEAFEMELAQMIAIAYMEAMDDAIVNGTGNGMPLGILNDPRIKDSGRIVEMTAAEFQSWTAWRKKFFAKLPLGYRAGEFIFPLSTVESYLETMSDSNNNPIFRQATGLEVNDAPGDVVGIFWQPFQYALNENWGFTMFRYFDQENNEWVDKALTVVDGSVLNYMGFWLIKKKA